MPVVKHSPIQGVRKANVIRVSSKTPFVSGLKRVSKLLDKTKQKSKDQSIVLVATGLAINRAIAISLELQSQNFPIEIRTTTVRVVDEHISDEKAEMKERLIGGVEIKVRPKA